MRLTNRPRYVLGAASLVGTTLAVSAFLVTAAALAQRCSGPPGCGWRDITPDSMWKRYRDGTDRQGQARKARERRR